MRITYFMLLMLIVSSFGCKKIDEFTKFDLEYKESITIPASSGINLPFDLFTPEVVTDSESSFAINDTRKDLIEEITLTSLDLAIVTPTDGDFRFLKSVSVYISAEGLSEIEIASLDPVPDNVGPTIELTTSENDLKEYIKKDQFKLRVQTVTDEILSEDHKIDVSSKFFVDAKILGQ